MTNQQQEKVQEIAKYLIGQTGYFLKQSDYEEVGLDIEEIDLLEDIIDEHNQNTTSNDDQVHFFEVYLQMDLYLFRRQLQRLVNCEYHYCQEHLEIDLAKAEDIIRCGKEEIKGKIAKYLREE